MNTKEQQWITKAVQLLKQMEFCGTNIDYGNWREPYVVAADTTATHVSYRSYLRRQRISNDSCSRL